jgi:hypothetical protein
MAVHLCGTCGQVRARAGEDICPVCWLVRELAREHRDGEHTTINESCVACTRMSTKPSARRARTARMARAVRANRIDHSKCDHPMIPSERAKCRAKKRGR